METREILLDHAAKPMREHEAATGLLTEHGRQKRDQFCSRSGYLSGYAKAFAERVSSWRCFMRVIFRKLAHFEVE